MHTTKYVGNQLSRLPMIFFKYHLENSDKNRNSEIIFFILGLKKDFYTQFHKMSTFRRLPQSKT
jgi:hypothetical protein